MSFGTVCAPGQRYHPAIIAQAAATLRELYGHRFWLALGSGEALNESITGDEWPDKARRNQRLSECVSVMRALWAGHTVDYAGLVRVKGAKLYMQTSNPPPIFAACLTVPTARWAGTWADGMITVASDREHMQAMIAAFRAGGGVGKPMYLQVALSYASTDVEALAAAHHEWRQAALPDDQLANTDSTESFDALTEAVTQDEVHNKIRVSASVEQHIEWLAGDLELGFERLFLHNVHRDQPNFIATFAKTVIPALTQ